MPNEPPEPSIEELLWELRRESRRTVLALRASMDLPEPPGSLADARENLAVTRNVFSKWSPEILVTLYSLDRLGFEELRRHLAGISSRVLSAKLKSLEAQGFLRRDVLGGRPPRVSYALTEDGRTLAELGEPVLLFLRRHQFGKAPPWVPGAPSPP